MSVEILALAPSSATLESSVSFLPSFATIKSFATVTPLIVMSFSSPEFALAEISKGKFVSIVDLVPV